ncbi:MAG: energy transducer TonB [Gemmatimonadaceae bacterium]|nr:energy transducer TonB [Gloeobacterales cyanobacterium ES-bin-141]
MTPNLFNKCNIRPFRFAGLAVLPLLLGPFAIEFQALASEPTPEPTTTAALSSATLVKPRMMEALQPEYPQIALQNSWQGKVVMNTFVLADGTVSEVKLLKSSGHAELDGAAIAAMKRMRFVPALQGDEALATWVRVPVTFTLSP